MEKKLPDFNLNGTNLVQMVWQKKFIIIGIGIVAFISSIIISFQLTPLYQSTAILIPAAATQASKDVFVDSRAKGLTVFGDDEEVEHLLQILSSETLRRATIEKQDLFNNYEIKRTEKEAWHKVNTKFSNNISFRRSRYRTVRIEVLDRSPAKSAEIANTIVVLADSLMRATKKEVALKALEVIEFQYNRTLADAYIADDSLTQIMKKGVFDITFQTKEVTKIYAEAIAKGNQDAISRIEKYIDKLATHGAALTRYQSDIQYRALQLKDMRESINILSAEAQGAIPSQFVIDWAVASDKKAKPKKIIIVIVSTLSTVFFTIFLLVLVGFIKTSIYPTPVAKE
jgi:tyrosine-protein kinase Etk/Wzc